MKTAWLWVVSLLAVFAPIKPAAIACLVLVFVDLITGVIAASRRGEAITSAKLKTTVIKLFIYEMAILMAFLAQQYLTGTVLPVCNLTTSVIGLTEMKSVLENLDSISGVNLFQALIDRVSRSKDQLP